MGRAKDFLVIGHRGARGLLPENSLPSFQKAIRLGVQGLEMDIRVSRDRALFVYHDARISAQLCLDAQQQHLDPGTAPRLFELTYAQIRSYICGALPQADFPEQTQLAHHIPLLRDVLQTAEKLAKRPLSYFLEIKSDPGTDELDHPKPAEFIRLVCEQIADLQLSKRCILISTDERCLAEARLQAPDLQLGLLLEGPAKSWPDLHKTRYRFVLPEFNFLDAQFMDNYPGMAVIPWTVNAEKDIRRMLKLGVAGLISDYPDRALTILQQYEQEAVWVD
jgi:glycerophosphoryl diester phosphodiesterase